VATHAVLAVAFGWWAWRLRTRRVQPAQTELPAHLEALEDEIAGMRQELSETQERLDFAERMLAQRANPEREPADRQGRPGPE
jgi:hypothetical protein